MEAPWMCTGCASPCSALASFSATSSHFGCQLEPTDSVCFETNIWWVCAQPSSWVHNAASLRPFPPAAHALSPGRIFKGAHFRRRFHAGSLVSRWRETFPAPINLQAHWNEQTDSWLTDSRQTCADSLRRHGGIFASQFSSVNTLKGTSLRPLSHSYGQHGRMALAMGATATEMAETESTGDENDAKSKELRFKSSPQLARWARARRVRSGRTGEPKLVSGTGNAVMQGPSITLSVDSDADSDEDESPGPEVQGKSIYMVSDGTGWTADHAVQAALGQFEHCLVDQRCSVDTHLFSQVNEVDRLMDIVRQAGQEGAILFYTLADPHMAEAAKEACQMLHVPHINILGPITDALEAHLGVSPSGIPRGAPGSKSTLSKQYFKRIEAVEFTIRQDDGALPKNLHQADLLLVGVSRTSKTPLSTYMAQKGYKVANVPLVLGIDPPKELFEVNQDKVYALTINPNSLKSIRVARYRSLGMPENSRTSYSDMEHIRKELEYSSKLFHQNPRWPVVEVTGKAIEETAAVILRIFHERQSKHQMPRISRRY